MILTFKQSDSLLIGNILGFTDKSILIQKQQQYVEKS